MHSESFMENSALDHVQPISRLKWEHRRFLGEFGGLALLARRPTMERGTVGEKASAILKFLELHQEAEERFLFPLVAGLGDGLLKELRDDHLNFLHASDSMIYSVQSGNQESLAESFDLFKIHLETHFIKEESAVFDLSAGLLSPAQMDILRIKFASREVPEI